MSKYIVLVTEGEHEDAHTASVHGFDTVDTADEFILNTRTGRTNHWVDAVMVEDGEDVELVQPDYPRPANGLDYVYTTKFKK